jgi:predicted nucleotidyltransferase
MIDQATIERAVDSLLEAAPDGSRVILFGSHARGDARPDSDLDFLVIEPRVADHRAEMVRLHHVLQPMRVPVDVPVTCRFRGVARYAGNGPLRSRQGGEDL